MIGLLTRVVVGAAFAGAAGLALYGVYKVLTRESIKEEINKKIEEQNVDLVDEEKNEAFFMNAFKAKYKGKVETGETFSFQILDEFDEPIGDVDIDDYDDIADDIEIGEEIFL
ncbi:MAG: hypothetical protein K6G76_03290 [Lachnospiraceae bacterium]|nr:hypothetical protein [Lachnospiraceae bacterium]